MNEADTRAELIDPKLKQAGWGYVAESRVQREYNINAGEIRSGGIRTGQMKADYVLAYKNRKLAVVEAKSVEVEVGEGVAQAKLYATKLELNLFTIRWRHSGKVVQDRGSSHLICQVRDVIPHERGDPSVPSGL